MWVVGTGSLFALRYSIAVKINIHLHSVAWFGEIIGPS